MPGRWIAVRAAWSRYDASCVAGAISENDYLAGLRAAGLVDAEVRDRLVYDEAQLESLFGSDAGCGCGSAAPEGVPLNAAKVMVDKVWSAKVYARKPF